MIQNFSDHAANERTFLAWVRSAIAIMAFGFLVARFNLFLRIAAQSLAPRAGRSSVIYVSGFGDVAGLILIVAGTVIIAIAAIRFFRTRRAIDSPEPCFTGVRADLLLAVLMVVLGVALVLYLLETLVRSP